MTRKRPDVQPCGERHEHYLHCLTCYPPPPERPERLQGPGVGARVVYHSKYPRHDGETATVTERSYVWAPGDPAYHGGSRRYDWKVIRFDSGSSLCVDDKDLTLMEEEVHENKDVPPDCQDSPTGKHEANRARWGDDLCIWCMESFRAPVLDGVAPHIPGTDYYDGRDGSIEADDDDEDRIAAEDESWRDFLDWQRSLGARN